LRTLCHAVDRGNDYGKLAYRTEYVGMNIAASQSAEPAPSPVADWDSPGRREFLAQIIGACAAFMAALLGIPLIGALVAPALKSQEASWLTLGSATSFQMGVPTSVSVSVTQTDGWIQTTQVRSVWVVRQPSDEFTVYNGRCTHLGCAYSWQAVENQFTCPCHAGVYGVEGHVLAGPPPRPLDTLPVRVEDGQLQTQYQDLRLGTPEKAPA
jgi:menaquinol-cytochrome c reductase iron-sulfur subunit